MTRKTKAEEGGDNRENPPEPGSDDRSPRHDDADSGLSPAIQQQGGAALAGVGRRRGSDVFRES